jgi:hypothetical protein
MASQPIKRLQKRSKLPREILWGTWLWAVIGLLSIVSTTADAMDTPKINVWYEGLRFGSNGAPQPWCNLLGSVSSAIGIKSLQYNLNGGPPVELSMGPDDRRLARAGDFNIDVRCRDLADGHNQVDIEVENMDANKSTATIELNYTSGTVGQLPYNIYWNTVEGITDVAQIVDGQWVLEDDRVRTLEPGYDRLIAVGDQSWRDYEIVVSFIVHQMLRGSYGVGVVVHWNGHTDAPLSGWQPKTGWRPAGGIGWYRGGALRIEDGERDLATDARITLDPDVRYFLKMRVETPPQQLPIYHLKIWSEDEAEPSAWNLSAPGRPHHPTAGSVLLIAHRADVSFGNVIISPLDAKSRP